MRINASTPVFVKWPHASTCVYTHPKDVFIVGVQMCVDTCAGCVYTHIDACAGCIKTHVDACAGCVYTHVDACAGCV